MLTNVLILLSTSTFIAWSTVPLENDVGWYLRFCNSLYLQARELDRYLSFVKKCEVVQKVLKDFHEGLCKSRMS